jgi:hypothetical protein
MPLPTAHPWHLSRDPDVQTLLDETVDVLARSRVSLRRSSEALIRADRDSAHQRKRLTELRRAIDRRFLEEISEPNFEAWKHDITVDPHRAANSTWYTLVGCYSIWPILSLQLFV